MMKRINMKMVFLAVMLLGVLLIASGCCIRHEWKEATCTEPSACAECGKTRGEAVGHTWQAATCARPKTCSACYMTEGAALGHVWQDADCLNPKTCMTCGLTAGNALGHNWQKATCTQAKTCLRCQDTQGKALGHNWLDANCTMPQVCSNCQLMQGNALGHTWQEASCTDSKYCLVCQARDGEALGHDVVGLTCETDGICQRCQTVFYTQGHQMLPADKERASLCSECGWQTGEPVSVPWYVGTDVLAVLQETGMTDVCRLVKKAVLTQNADEIEYTVNSEGAQIIFDDGQRALLLSESMLYLCKREDKNAVIHAAVKNADFLHIDSLWSEGLERSMAFGNGVVFCTTDNDNHYSLYYLDWETLALYKYENISSVSPSFEGNYWICKNGDQYLVIDYAQTKVYTGRISGSLSTNRVTEQGVVLFRGLTPVGYLCFENMVVFDTLMEGKVGFAGDDYYIRIDEYALEMVTETARSTWLKKVDNRVLQYDDVTYRTIGNLFSFTRKSSNTYLYFMGNTADQQIQNMTVNGGLGYASSQRRYMAINLSSSSLFSSWYILKLGSNEYIPESEAKASLMDYNNYHISESAQGYLMNRENDLLAGKGNCYRTLKEKGYYVYSFEGNTGYWVKLSVNSSPSLDVLK